MKMSSKWHFPSSVCLGSMSGKYHRVCQTRVTWLNTLRLRQNGRNFADDIFKCIFFNENAWISLKISLKFVRKVRINNIPALVQIMAWCRPGDKPLSELRVGFLPEETYFFQDIRKKVEETCFFKFCADKTGRNWTKLEKNCERCQLCWKKIIIILNFLLKIMVRNAFGTV